MQSSLFPATVPTGYVRFFPDTATEIFLALGGAQALGRVGAHSILSSHNALQIEVCASNGVTIIHVTQNSLKAYDIFFYNKTGACVSNAYHVYQHELAGVFRSGTGLVNFKRKYVRLDQAVCYDEKAVAA